MIIKPSAAIRTWEEERHRIRVEESLMNIEAERANGIMRYTPVEEVFSEIDRIIDEAEATSKKIFDKPEQLVYHNF